MRTLATATSTPAPLPPCCPSTRGSRLYRGRLRSRFWGVLFGSQLAIGRRLSAIARVFCGAVWAHASCVVLMNVRGVPPFPKLCEPVTIVLHVVLPEMHGEVCEPLRACPRDVEVADIPDDRGRVGEPAEVPKFVFDGWVEVRIGGRGSRAEFNMGRKSRARIEADVRQYPPGPPPPLFEDSQNWALMGSPSSIGVSVAGPGYGEERCHPRDTERQGYGTSSARI